MKFTEFYMVEEVEIFKTSDGIVKYASIDLNDTDQTVEYTDPFDIDFWNKAKQWIEITSIVSNVKHQGRGKILLKDFINSLPLGIGIVLNANPLNYDNLDPADDTSFEDLHRWYLKQGFKEYSKWGSLYYIKH